MNEDERVEEGLKVENEYELQAYKVYNRTEIAVTIFECLFCLGFIGAITFLAWHFNNANLTWWYLVPAICYGGVSLGNN